MRSSVHTIKMLVKFSVPSLHTQDTNPVVHALWQAPEPGKCTEGQAGNYGKRVMILIDKPIDWVNSQVIVKRMLTETMS